jgi:hypothetical protein
MEGAGFGESALALFQKVGDVFAAERLELEGVLDGSGGGVGSVDFTQGHDLADVVRDVEAPVLEFAVERLGPGREGEEPEHELLVAGPSALLQEFARMVGVLEVLMAVVGAPVPGDQLLLVIDAEVSA